MPAPDDPPPSFAGVRGAVSFLTVLPAGRLDRIGAAAVGRGAIYFPIVGAAVGGAAAASAWSLSLVLPALVAAFAAVGVSAALTGAIHLDGLADTVDGYGGRTATRALEIMRDHAVGTFGVVALVLDIGLRVAAIEALLTRPHRLLYLVAAGALSRAAAVGIGALVPDARAGGGHMRVLDAVGWKRAAVTAAIGVAIAAGVVGLATLPATAAVGAASVLWGWHCKRRLGGVTGDTLGAASEGGELLVLLLAVGLR